MKYIFVFLCLLIAGVLHSHNGSIHKLTLLIEKYDRLTINAGQTSLTVKATDIHNIPGYFTHAYNTLVYLASFAATIHTKTLEQKKTLVVEHTLSNIYNVTQPKKHTFDYSWQEDKKELFLTLKDHDEQGYVGSYKITLPSCLHCTINSKGNITFQSSAAHSKINTSGSKVSFYQTGLHTADKNEAQSEIHINTCGEVTLRQIRI